MDGLEAFLVDVSVNLGGGNIGVAEEFLNDPEVGAIFQEVRGKGVAEKVGVDVLINAGGLGAFLDDLANADG